MEMKTDVNISKKLLAGAKKVIEVNSATKEGENVLIITDTGRDLSVMYALLKAALEVKANPIIIVLKERTLSSEEPPSHAISAMFKSDVILGATSQTIYYNDATRIACEKGSRFLSMTHITPDVLMSPALLEVNPYEIKPIVEKIATILTQAKNIKVTTQGGTSLKMSVDGRKAYLVTGIADTPGAITSVPDLEVFLAPIEDSINGVAIVDGTVSTFGLVKEEIKIVIKNGVVEKIIGTSDAEKLSELLKKTGDNSVYQVAELGIGLNPKAQLRGDIIEDEGCLGTVHIALGDNSKFGGKNLAPLHIDLVMKNSTIEVDGKILLKGRKILV
jgi:leucyl aminopeptidase (aminopeptidase T)